VPSAPLAADDGAGDPLAAIQFALAHGRPVLVLVDGAALGRGDRYGGHFVVVTGMEVQTGPLDVVDPDTQAPRSAGWQPGGRQRWPLSLARSALTHAGDGGSFDAIIVGATRPVNRTPSPTRLLIVAGAAILALLGLWPVRRRRGVSRASR